MAVSKQSAELDGAMIGIGLSPLRPKKHCSKSVCSVLVGNPVDGPPRWTLTMTSGSSSMIARPIASLFRHIPGPLVPVRLGRVDAIPLAASGKVDEQALAAAVHGRLPERPYRAPEGPLEEFLTDLWQTELGVERVGADDSFFSLGGSSLTAMQVMLQLCSEYDIDLPLESMFSHPVLAELARLAEDRIFADVEQMTAES